MFLPGQTVLEVTPTLKVVETFDGPGGDFNTSTGWDFCQ